VSDARRTPSAEFWRCDAGEASVAVLDIPGALDRARSFDVDVTLLVRVPAQVEGAWHALTVEFDGKRQWSRRIASNNPGQTDGLDYHARVELLPGQALRVRAAAQVGRSRIAQLLVEAREESATG